MLSHFSTAPEKVSLTSTFNKEHKFIVKRAQGKVLTNIQPGKAKCVPLPARSIITGFKSGHLVRITDIHLAILSLVPIHQKFCMNLRLFLDSILEVNVIQLNVKVCCVENERKRLARLGLDILQDVRVSVATKTVCLGSLVEAHLVGALLNLLRIDVVFARALAVDLDDYLEPREASEDCHFRLWLGLLCVARFDVFLVSSSPVFDGGFETLVGEGKCKTSERHSSEFKCPVRKPRGK